MEMSDTSKELGFIKSLKQIKFCGTIIDWYQINSQNN